MWTHNRTWKLCLATLAMFALEGCDFNEECTNQPDGGGGAMCLR